MKNTKTIRGFFCLCIAVILLIGMLPRMTAHAATPVTSYSDLQAAINAAPIGVQTVIELQNSFSATGGVLTIAAGKNIVLTSTAGSIFTFTQTNPGSRHFSVAGSLTLQNVTLSGPGGGTTAIIGGVDVPGGTLILESGGTITNCRAPGSNSSSYGGGVNVMGGSLIINGGTISNNATSWVGGGALLTGNSTFTMTSGTISGNTSVTGGGGVQINNGNATISGGTITSNMATGSSALGGGMSLQAADLIMTGGSITNNRAVNGGGIYIDNSAMLTMSAGTISNNIATSNGGGIFTAQYTSNNPLPPNSYINLTIGSTVVFTGNVAGSGARVPPANVGTMTQISTTLNSSIYTNPLNNLDINYFGSPGVMVTALTVIFDPGAYGTFPAGTQTRQSVPTTNSPLVPSAPIPVPQPGANYGFIGWSSDGGVTVLSSAQVLVTPISDNTTYVAQYVPPITVIFDAQGGAPAIQTVTPVQVTGTYANGLSQVTTPTLDGYVFRGWFTTPNGVSGGMQILPTSIVTQMTDQVLYAHWAGDPTVTVTFDANGGTPATQVMPSRVVGSTYAATLDAIITPTLSYYVFAGWFTAPIGGTQITATSIIPAVNTTVYAQWMPIPTIIITFDAQGGTPDGQQQSLQTGNLYGSALSLVQSPTQMGYAFTGWWTTPNGDTSGVQILPSTVVTATTNQTLYAHWTAVTVTITFDGQGGTPATQAVPGQIPFYSYAPVLAAIATPTRAGYVFQGWYQLPTGGGSVNQYSLIPPIDMTVYAWWTPAPVITITFDGQGGTPSSQTETVTMGDTYASPLSQVTNPTQTGYIFGGWWTTPNGNTSGVQILPTTVVTTTTNQTLYAHWIADPTVTITFDAQGGTPDTQILTGRTAGNTYAATLAAVTTPTQAGFIFQGWFSAPTGGSLITNASIIPSSDTTVYAQWTPEAAITVTFDSQGGYFDMSYVIPGSGVTLSPDWTLAYYTPVTIGGTFQQAMSAVPDPTPPSGTYYYFDGWWTTPNGDTSGVQVLPTSTVWDSPGGITLYVHWGITPTVTLTFDAQGGTPATQVRRGAVVGMEVLVSYFIQTPTRAGYTFLGWFDAQSGGNQITDSSIIPGSDTTYYAQWSPNPPINVTFNAQGGTPDGQQQMVVPGTTYGSALSQIQSPMQIGYVFGGWWTTPNGNTSGVQILPSTVVTATSNQTLYAHWVEVSVTITFDAQGGTPAIQVVSGQMPLASYSPVLASITSPTQTGYIFQGWYDRPQSMGGSHITSGSLIPPMTTTVYAWWTPAPIITVTFDAQGGTPSMETATITTGDTYAAAFAVITNPSLAGYILSGWFTAPISVAGGVQILDTGVQILDTTIVTVMTDQTLYARWVPDPTVTITFDAQGGTPDMQIVPGRVPGSSYAATLAAITAPTQPGFVFLGWFSAPTGGSPITGYSTIPSVDTTVYAQWGPIPTITITFDAQGGTPDGQTASLQTGDIYGNAISLIQSPTLAGYVFAGWFTTPNGDASGVQILDGTVVTATTDQTLYAHWVAMTVTIIFDAQGGMPALQVVPGKIPGSLYTDTFNSIIVPTKALYTFQGWFDAPVGGTEIVSTDYVPVADTILYAQWAPTQILVSFNALGAVPVLQEELGVTGDTYAAPFVAITTPTMEGSIFVGWFTQIIGGIQVFPSDIITQTTDQTLYARFISTLPMPYTPPVTPPSPSPSPVPTATPAPPRVPSRPTAPPPPPLPIRPAPIIPPASPEYPTPPEFPILPGDAIDIQGDTYTRPFEEENVLITLMEIHHAYLLGEEDGRIGPNDFITRAEVATILLRIISDETRVAFWTLENPFPDVPNNGGAWFSNGVSVMNNMGIMIGYPDGTFRPEQLTTRAEIVTIMMKFLPCKPIYDGTADMFPDISTHWARDNINVAAQLGWISGYPDGNFKPNEHITRAEFVAIINGILGRTITDIDTVNMRIWIDNTNKDEWFHWAIQIASNCAPNVFGRNWIILQQPNARPEDVIN